MNMKIITFVIVSFVALSSVADEGMNPDRPRIIRIPGLSSTKCSYRNGMYKIVDYFGHVYETPYKVDFDNAIKDIKKRGNLRKNTNVYHVPTAEEIAAAEEERRRQEALEEDRRRFYAQLDVERERVRAIEDQNAILNGIQWSINNQPAPVNNTYIVVPPPQRRWR